MCTAPSLICSTLFRQRPFYLHSTDEETKGDWIELAESQDEDKSLPLILQPTQDLLDEDIWTKAPPHSIPLSQDFDVHPLPTAWSWPIPQPRPSVKSSHLLRAASSLPL